MRYILLLSALLILVGCASTPSETKPPLGRHNLAHANGAHDSKTTLSYVRAYLLIGNIKKAEEHFTTLQTPALIPGALMALAELHAAKGNSVDAQQTFLLALTDTRFDASLNTQQVSANLLDYFCTEKKWPALQGYGSALVARAPDNPTQNTSPSGTHLKNNALTQIGLCFFNKQRLDEAHKWLLQLDDTQQLAPQAYLALARISVEQKLYSAAQQLINQYEATKTKIDAKMLWTAFEVYQALKQPEIAKQLGENLRALFPGNKYTRKYIMVVKRGDRMQREQQKTTAPLQTTHSTSVIKQTAISQTKTFHIIRKGETLYQISIRYDVSILDLLTLNPTLVVDDISLGTSIRLSAN